MTVVVGTGGRYVSGGDAAGAALPWPRGLVLSVLGAVPKQAAGVAGC